MIQKSIFILIALILSSQISNSQIFKFLSWEISYSPKLQAQILNVNAFDVSDFRDFGKAKENGEGRASFVPYKMSVIDYSQSINLAIVIKNRRSFLRIETPLPLSLGNSYNAMHILPGYLLYADNKMQIGISAGITLAYEPHFEMGKLTMNPEYSKIMLLDNIVVKDNGFVVEEDLKKYIGYKGGLDFRFFPFEKYHLYVISEISWNYFRQNIHFRNIPDHSIVATGTYNNINSLPEIYVNTYWIKFGLGFHI